jgi:hypothetical protein
MQGFEDDERWRKAGRVERSIFRIPFFLNQLLHSEQIERSRAAAFEQFFATHALPPSELDKAASAAIAVYRQDRARMVPLEEFRNVAGGDTTNRLLEAGVIQASSADPAAWSAPFQGDRMRRSVDLREEQLIDSIHALACPDENTVYLANLYARASTKWVAQ